MNNVFPAVIIMFLIVAVIIFIASLFSNIKRTANFPEIEGEEASFFDPIAKGGSHDLLDIKSKSQYPLTVTLLNEVLWIKPNIPPFGFSYQNQVHSIQLHSIKSAGIEANVIKISYRLSKYNHRVAFISTKDNEGLLSLLVDQKTTHNKT
jgi:hypothetical protein